ncbi:hypothetical protein [Bacillus atrophaeus]|nr:hypothetical protein [Bacillus atrophaeus]
MLKLENFGGCPSNCNIERFSERESTKKKAEDTLQLLVVEKQL